MRYLYADSEPFPLDYDFLGTLKAFVTCAARCLEAATAIEKEEGEIFTKEGAATRRVTALGSFREALDAAIDAAVQRSPEPDVARDVAANVKEYAGRAVELANAEGERALTEARTALSKRVSTQRDAIRESVTKFLLGAALEVSESRFAIKLDDGAYRMTAICSLPRGVEASYELGVASLEEWRSPRKVKDLVGGLELQVGVKKKFLTKDITREVASVDDHYVSFAELDSRHATVGLKKKPDSPTEQMVLTMVRIGDEIESEIRRPSERTSAGESIFPAVPDDVSKLHGLWEALERASNRTLAHRRSVSQLTLDGQSLFEGRRVSEWVERYVEHYRPIVTEIAKRSPSPKELSLKLEHSDGRREEIYLRRSDLAQVIGELDDEHMQVFAPFDFFPEVEVDME